MAIYASDKFDFYRPVTIQYLTDSNKTATGTEYIYTTISNGVLSSLEPPIFRFGHAVTRNFLVLIENGDNSSLHIDSAIAKGNVYDLTIRFPEKVTYFLYYGNKNISQADYDLPVFRDKIPAGLSEVAPGEEQLIPKTPVPVVKPLFENKMWLWAIMAVIILLLGWFSVKMIRTKQ